MLTGALPFYGHGPDGVGALPHRQDAGIAACAPKTVPATISGIVDEAAAAKMAEERYRSAAGLEATFGRCWKSGSATAASADFPLGAHGTPRPPADSREL